jgi:TetR/AcrR family transcriptional regulator, lmrAB and yxaGH operons repressor
MARPQSIEDGELNARLTRVFSDVGYEGASLAMLSEATGLKKASLYHRFPRGKQQMAEDVIGVALAWYEDNILLPLRGDLPPADRVALVVERLDAFYAHGRQACLLNMLASPRSADGPFSAAIKSAFELIVEAFAKAAQDAGHDQPSARHRAERTVMLLHGSLVMSRGLGSPAPFQTFLRGLAEDLLGDKRGTSSTLNTRTHHDD